MREAIKPNDFSALSSHIHTHLDSVSQKLGEWKTLYNQGISKGEFTAAELADYHTKADGAVMELRKLASEVYYSEFPEFAQEGLLMPVAKLLMEAENFYQAVDELCDASFEESDTALASFAGDGITLEIRLPADILIDGEAPEAKGLDQAGELTLNCSLSCCLSVNGANIRFQRILHGPNNVVTFLIDMPADVRFRGEPLDEETRNKETAAIGVQETAAITINGVEITLAAAFPAS